MIVIAGAGIGGLTLGCALAKAGIEFRVFERSEKLRPVGAGIALSANGLRALAYLGLDDQVRKAGHEIATAAIWDSKGRVLLETPVQQIAPGGTIAIEREHLHNTLQNALNIPVSLGKAISGYENLNNGVRVHFADDDVLDADLLIGADGLHSAVRRTMRGEEPLRYSGQTSWRALVDNFTLLQPDLFTESWGGGRRFGIVPLKNNRVYWFAVTIAESGGRDKDDPRIMLREHFAGWHSPIDKLLAATRPESIIRTDIFDRPPINNWIDAHVVLLGDAAHPMTPNTGMGGCQAIEDAVVLAGAISENASYEDALAQYQERRIERANGFVNKSYRVGQMAHLRSRPLTWLRDRVLQQIPISFVANAMAREYDFRQ